MKKHRGVKGIIIVAVSVGLCGCGLSENQIEPAISANSELIESPDVVQYDTPVLGNDDSEEEAFLIVEADEEADDFAEVIETDENSAEVSEVVEENSDEEAVNNSTEAETSLTETNEVAEENATDSNEVAEENLAEANELAKDNSKEADKLAEENSKEANELAEEENNSQETNEVANEEALAEGTVATTGTVGGGMFASYDLQTLENIVYSEEQLQQITAFYEGSVFAGDSVLLGFRNYSGKSSDPMLKQLQFLAAGSLSLHNSFWPVSEKSVHPLYQGAQHPIWESIQMMGARKAFLFFGINDVSSNMDESVSLYPQLVDKIKELSPDVEINIISATYTLKDKGKGKLNNENLAIFNSRVQELAAQNGWGYIDMANILSDGAGNLAEQYCSDGFLHESYKAYDVWKMVLMRYAADRLGF